jgi:hypothetical protein
MVHGTRRKVHGYSKNHYRQDIWERVHGVGCKVKAKRCSRLDYEAGKKP